MNTLRAFGLVLIVLAGFSLAAWYNRSHLVPVKVRVVWVTNHVQVVDRVREVWVTNLIADWARMRPWPNAQDFPARQPSAAEQAVIDKELKAWKEQTNR